jgi:cytochrome c biogenesis protein CcdA
MNMAAACTGLSRQVKKKMRNRDKYKPAVTRATLLFLAGFVWVCVGVMLLVLATLWLSTLSVKQIYLFTGAGVLLALLAHRFLFVRIVDRNLKRILPIDEKTCLFAFIPWKSYLIILVMISMGVTLRHSAVPKPYLATLYIGMGLALVLSSMRYLRAYIRGMRR